MSRTENIRIRALTDREKADMEKDVYDSFANYACLCGSCGHVERTNIYLMRANERLEGLRSRGVKCPRCGACNWILGYPADSKTGFVGFAED